jgi:hypothetical protein
MDTNNVDTNKCIFCLSDHTIIQKYDAPCDCKPYIHISCLEQWFEINPNECPICRINYESNSFACGNSAFQPVRNSGCQTFIIYYILGLIFINLLNYIITKIT